MVAIEILKIKKECSKVYICALTRMLCMYCHVIVYCCFVVFFFYLKKSSSGNP